MISCVRSAEHDMIPIDVAILGGGIAGLWLLAHLRAQDCNAFLFERVALGASQTVASQGIIHGGAKYALLGKITHASDSVRDMPQRWRAALHGADSVNLAAAQVSSEAHYLFSTRALASGVSTFFASKLMSARSMPLPREDAPQIFRNPTFRGSLYRLDEVVLDVPSVLAALAQPHLDRCVLVPRAADLRLQQDDGLTLSVSLGARAVRLAPRALVLAAGAGNADLLAALGRTQPAMQRRPLHMVMVRHPSLPPLYAHALGLSATPRLTITTHRCSDGSAIWYVGGEIAESGVTRSETEQIACARRELAEVFPWINLSSASYSTVRIDRAEMAHPGGSRPDDVTMHVDGSLITLWPTKLALAPRAADLVTDVLSRLPIPRPDEVPTSNCAVDALRPFPRPAIALPPWETATSWYTQ